MAIECKVKSGPKVMLQGAKARCALKAIFLFFSSPSARPASLLFHGALLNKSLPAWGSRLEGLVGKSLLLLTAVQLQWWLPLPSRYDLQDYHMRLQHLHFGRA